MGILTAVVSVGEDGNLHGLIKTIPLGTARRPYESLRLGGVRQFGGVVDPISDPEDDVVASAGAFRLVRFLRGSLLSAPSRHPLAVLALEEPAERPGLAHRLEAFFKVLVVVAVDDGINARIGKGQPVGGGEDVAGQKVHLVTVQASVVRHHHQGPERQPGEHEEQSHHDEHLYHHDLFPGYHGLPPPSFPCFNRAVGHRWLSAGEQRGAQLDSNAPVHDHDDDEGHQVDVQEQNHCVDLPHVGFGKVFVARVER